MNLIYHKGLDKTWFGQSVSYQLANVGSEISRTINWLRKDREDYAEISFFRALELVDLTVEDPKNRQRLKEILRVREGLVEAKLSNKLTSDWLKYFDTFALAARN